MSAARLIERGLTAPLTNQQLADMALAEDQAARAAVRAGDIETAERHRVEADKLASLLT